MGRNQLKVLTVCFDRPLQVGCSKFTNSWVVHSWICKFCEFVLAGKNLHKLLKATILWSARISIFDLQHWENLQKKISDTFTLKRKQEHNWGPLSRDESQTRMIQVKRRTFKAPGEKPGSCTLARCQPSIKEATDLASSTEVCCQGPECLRADWKVLKQNQRAQTEREIHVYLDCDLEYLSCFLTYIYCRNDGKMQPLIYLKSFVMFQKKMFSEPLIYLIFSMRMLFGRVQCHVLWLCKSEFLSFLDSSVMFRVLLSAFIILWC